MLTAPSEICYLLQSFETPSVSLDFSPQVLTEI